MRLLLLGPLLASPAIAQHTLHADLTYKTVNGAPLRLDVYEPDANGPHPLVIWIHGGAWMSGTKALAPGRIQGLLDANVAVASIEYRLTTQSATFGDVTFPAQIDDVQDAILWLRANAAAFDLDQARIGTWGTSAGGHLAALAGTLGSPNDPRGDTSVQAVGDGFGPTDFFELDADAVNFGCTQYLVHDDPSSPESRLVGFDGPGEGIGVLAGLPGRPEHQLVLDANPITFLDPADPPMFVVHGEGDCTISVGQSRRLLDACEALGVDVTLVTHPGGHTLPASLVGDFHDFFTRELAGTERIVRTVEAFDVPSLVPLDAQGVPVDHDNETVRTASLTWSGCNLSTTVGALPHGVLLDPHPAVSTDGGSLFFNAGALTAGSRAAARLVTPADLTAGGHLRLRIGKASSPGGTRFRVLLRDGVAWWLSSPVTTPVVPGAASASDMTIELAPLSWNLVDTSSGAGADLDEIDDGGETGALVELGAGTPDLTSVDGIGFQMAAGNNLTRMFAIDHLELAVTWTPVGEVSCTSLPNSTGRAAALAAYGSADATQNDLRLRADDLPANAFGLLISGRVGGSAPLLEGVLCLGSPLGRHLDSVASSGAAGEIEVAIDLTAMPAASPPFTAAVVPGETWYFQWWHRDVVAGPTANLSNAIAVSFH
ncbi:MAG: alpha/beta hydrolase [Planctomycetota bacterium]|nr:alpha/beta hydrolase [Planctomycetota bacterium]